MLENIGVQAIRRNWWMLALRGVLAIIFGIVLFVFPRAGILSILWLVGIYGIVFGVLFIVRAFQMRSLASSVAT